MLYAAPRLLPEVEAAEGVAAAADEDEDVEGAAATAATSGVSSTWEGVAGDGEATLVASVVGAGLGVGVGVSTTTTDDDDDDEEEEGAAGSATLGTKGVASTAAELEGVASTTGAEVAGWLGSTVTVTQSISVTVSVVS